ncbi:MAG: hypothetical protein VKJ24_03355 [Synechococcales bacterium]|nr:hypothetical protein [Synechococcales bacterium]
MMMKSLLVLTAMFFGFPTMVRAESFEQYPTIAPMNTGSVTCYAQTAVGNTVDLSRICGLRTFVTPVESGLLSPSNGLMGPAIAPTANFFPMSNPNNLLDNNNPSANRCYIVDSDGSPCAQ